MGKEILKFGDIEIEKNKFCRNKTPIFLKNVDVQIVLVSNKISFGEKSYKYFIIAYLYNDHNVKPLHIMFPKISACYDGKTKQIYFLIDDDDVLEKCDTNWDKVSADIKKEFDSDPFYKKILETKIKTNGNEVTDFYDKKILKVESKQTLVYQ